MKRAMKASFSPGQREKFDVRLSFRPKMYFLSDAVI